MNSKSCSCVLSHKQVHFTNREGIHINNKQTKKSEKTAAHSKPPVLPLAARVLTCYLHKKAYAFDYKHSPFCWFRSALYWSAGPADRRGYENSSILLSLSLALSTPLSFPLHICICLSDHISLSRCGTSLDLCWCKPVTLSLTSMSSCPSTSLELRVRYLSQ